jgi:hypothetical protein
MDYRELMTEAAQIFTDRHNKYGDMRMVMDRVAQISTLITGIHLTPHDIALILVALKLARMNNNRREKENYVDGINYFAFAGDLIDAEDTNTPKRSPIDDALDAGIAEFAAKFAPEKPDMVTA